MKLTGSNLSDGFLRGFGGLVLFVREANVRFEGMFWTKEARVHLVKVIPLKDTALPVESCMFFGLLSDYRTDVVLRFALDPGNVKCVSLASATFCIVEMHVRFGAVNFVFKCEFPSRRNL